MVTISYVLFKGKVLSSTNTKGTRISSYLLTNSCKKKLLPKITPYSYGISIEEQLFYIAKDTLFDYSSPKSPTYNWVETFTDKEYTILLFKITSEVG